MRLDGERRDSPPLRPLLRPLLKSAPCPLSIPLGHEVGQGESEMATGRPRVGRADRWWWRWWWWEDQGCPSRGSLRFLERWIALIVWSTAESCCPGTPDPSVAVSKRSSPARIWKLRYGQAVRNVATSSLLRPPQGHRPGHRPGGRPAQFKLWPCELLTRHVSFFCCFFSFRFVRR